MFIFAVAPHGGAWIEITEKLSPLFMPITSLPTGERGLKSTGFFPNENYLSVAPHGGAWIEIQKGVRLHEFACESLPTGERGLK